MPSLDLRHASQPQPDSRQQNSSLQHFSGASAKDFQALRRRRRLAETLRSPKRSALLRRQDGKCALCGVWFNPDEDIPLIDEHHHMPRHQGGSDKLDNLQLVHRWCHHAHHTRIGYRTAEA
jgi:RNA-directed DNA polymerase